MRGLLCVVLALWAPACHLEAEPPAAQEHASPAAQAELERYKAEIRAELPQVSGIGVNELARRLTGADTPVLIDVRTPAEFAVSHLRGAQRADTLQGALELLQHTPREDEIVVYCSIGYRSGHLAAELQQQGFTHVRNLEGSIFEWANTGHAVFSAETQVQRVHPYDAQWGRLLDRRLWSEIE